MTNARMKKNGDHNIEALIWRAIKHDLGAFEAIVQIYIDRIKLYITNRVSDFHEAEDLTQEVFVKTYKAIGSFNPKGPVQQCFEGWLYTIARNEATDYLRKSGKVAMFVDFQSDPPSDNLSPAELVELCEEIKRIEKAWVNLPHKEKEALDLRVSKKKSYKEIARIQRTTVGTVKKRIYNARNRLRQ